MSTSIITHRFVPFGVAVAVTAALGLGSAALWPHSPAHSVTPVLQPHHASPPRIGLHDFGTKGNGGTVVRGF
jgi:hypothetical protein